MINIEEFFEHFWVECFTAFRPRLLRSFETRIHVAVKRYSTGENDSFRLTKTFPGSSLYAKTIFILCSYLWTVQISQALIYYRDSISTSADNEFSFPKKSFLFKYCWLCNLFRNGIMKFEGSSSVKREWRRMNGHTQRQIRLRRRMNVESALYWHSLMSWRLQPKSAGEYRLNPHIEYDRCPIIGLDFIWQKAESMGVARQRWQRHGSFCCRPSKHQL